MKKILQLGVVCASIGFIMAGASSCSKPYNAGAYPGQDTTKNSFRGSFTASIDDEPFSAENKWASDVTNGGVRTISVSGIMDSKSKDAATNKTISLSITGYTGPGDYYIQSGTVGMYEDVYKGTSNIYLAKTSDSANVIHITNDAPNIEGTFYLQVAPGGIGNSDNHNVTNGSFSVPK